MLTVDAASGADLLLNEIPRKKERDGERGKKEKREVKHLTNGQRRPLCAKPPLESMTSDLEDQIRIESR